MYCHTSHRSTLQRGGAVSFRCHLHQASSTGSKGFTLIELMVVVAIIGILTSIAIPVFKDYRQSAYQKTVLSDIRQAATAEEAYLAINQKYTAFGPATGPTVVNLGPATSIRVSSSVTIQGTVNADSSAVTISATHPGATSTISYSSVVGNFSTP